MPGNPKRMVDFTTAADALLGVPTPMHVCTHYRGGTGEVLQFTNLGCNTKHVVTTEKDKLPANLRNLPEGTDIMVTFATGSVATMACNWVATVRKAGVNEVVIGALDQEMMDACEKANVPCVKIEGGAVSKALSQRSAANVRSDPALYPKMSVLKVGFYRELLSFGFNVWACDADAVLRGRPAARSCGQQPSGTDRRRRRRHRLHRHARATARSRCCTATSTPGSSSCALDPRCSPSRERWRETIATPRSCASATRPPSTCSKSSGEPLATFVRRGAPLPRCRRGARDAHAGRAAARPLPQRPHLLRAARAHAAAGAEPPLAVHMTYQFAEGSKFAHGKRQRLRQAGLWLVDDDSYFNGTAHRDGSTCAGPPRCRPRLGRVDSREAVRVASGRGEAPCRACSARCWALPGRSGRDADPAAPAVLLRLHVEGDEGVPRGRRRDHAPAL